MAKIIFIIGALLLVALCESSPSTLTSIEYAPTVELKSGKVRGLVEEVQNGSKLYFYQGIRFGQANRFEKSRPVDAWSGVYDAIIPQFACPQPLILNDPLIVLAQSPNISEDCLYLNVWRPVEEKENRTVMFYIHGGAFTIGTIFAPLTDARYIASLGDVIVVAINYRLGPFGFLVGGNVPPNLGLHDQILGLKWVKDNIRAFGGNPEDVTIIGASAGSMSVGSLILSPLTKGFFKRAILQTGTPNSKFAANPKSKAVEITRNFAKTINCSNEDIEQVINCFKNKTVAEITAQTSIVVTNPNFFVPIYGDEVMPKKPIDALKDGDFNRGIDILVGVVRDEGTLFVAQALPELNLEPANLTIDSSKKDIVKIMEYVSFNQTAAEEVATFYTANLTNPSDDDLKVTISESWGDYELLCPTIIFTEIIAKHEPQNRYFNYQLSQPVAIPGAKKWMGVTHGQDSFLIFMPQLLNRAEDRDIQKDLTEGLTSFAKSGEPGKFGTVEWAESFDRSSSEPITRYLNLDINDLKMVNEGYRNRCTDFWEKRM